MRNEKWVGEGRAKHEKSHSGEVYLYRMLCEVFKSEITPKITPEKIPKSQKNIKVRMGKRQKKADKGTTKE